MQKILNVRRFDLRTTDFRTGRRMSPPTAERLTCDCCGQRLVKGRLTNLGTLGDDCYQIIDRATTGLDSTLEDFEVTLKRQMNWQLKPAVRRFMAEKVFT